MEWKTGDRRGCRWGELHERPRKGALGGFQSTCCPLSGVGLTSRDRCDLPRVTAPGEGLLVGTWVKLTHPSRVPSGHTLTLLSAAWQSHPRPSGLALGGGDLLLALQSPGPQRLPDLARPQPTRLHGLTPGPGKGRTPAACQPAGTRRSSKAASELPAGSRVRALAAHPAGTRRAGASARHRSGVRGLLAGVFQPAGQDNGLNWTRPPEEDVSKP